MAKFFTPSKISENIRETPEGYLLCLGVPIARTGWQEYGANECPLEPGPDGIVKVYRDKKEVLRPITVASFQGKSVTIQHPREFVVPENWKDLTKGLIQNPRPGTEPDEDGEEQILADLLITDSMAIQLVKNGLREVSCGYEAEYEQTGEGEGRQFNIIGNHVALVEEGRAGSAYAIMDHKGKESMTPKFLEALKKKLGAKVVDEAMAEAEEKKDDKAKDAAGYDELVKMVKDLSDKIDGMNKGKDEEKKDPPAEEKKDDKAKDEGEEASEEKAKDDDGEEMKIEERVKALEAAVAKLLEKMGGESEDEAEEGEEAEDADEDSEEGEEAEDEESQLTGDAARLEILSPGIEPLKNEKPEDTKKRAIVAAFGTKDGREVIQSITGSRKLVLDSADKVNLLFMSASEVLKARRGTGLEGTKDGEGFKTADGGSDSPITAEKMNEINAQHWANRK